MHKSEMEKAESWERKSVISEVSQGIELSIELKKQLQKETCHSRDESCRFLVEKIVSCYDNALSLLNCMDFVQNQLHLIQASPTTDVSEDVNKKRKNLPRWSEEVRDEIQIDDGFNWRKYGQKDILGSPHPRSYYRCTHRYTQGCLATKQVQRGDDEASVLKVAYRGKHTCVVKQTNENVKAETNDGKQDMLINIESELNAVEPQELINCETQFLSEPTTELYLNSMPLNYNDTMMDHSFVALEPCLPEMISNSSSTTNFPDEDSDYLIDQIDFDFDAADYFSLVQSTPEGKNM